MEFVFAREVALNETAIDCGYGSVAGRYTVGMVFRKANPFSRMSIEGTVVAGLKPPV